jgi:hypothetical protein
MTHSSTLSFREKSAWISLAVLLLVYIPYFVYVSKLVREAQFNIGTAVGVFIVAVIFQIVVAVIAQIFISIRTRVAPKDERDIAIESKGFRNAYFVLTVGICLAALFVAMIGLGESVTALAAAQSGGAPPFLQKLRGTLSPATATQVLLLCLVAAEVIRYGTQVFCYRRGS